MTDTNTVTGQLADGISRVLNDIGEPNVDPFALTEALLQAGWLPPGAERVDAEAEAPAFLEAASAEHYLEAAAQQMRDRAASRDAKGGERSMGRTVAGFNALYGAAIHQRLRQGLPALSETMGWEFMTVLKKARGAAGRYREDDYTDDVAYSALAAESASSEREDR